MFVTALLTAALLLSLERMTYYWVWVHPEAFSRVCETTFLRQAGDPIHILSLLFYLFKLIQIAVFLGWCAWFGDELWFLPTAGGFALGAGAVLIAAGQVLNFSVFSATGQGRGVLRKQAGP